MNISETIKNIRASCENYTDPELVSTIIYDNLTMGASNFEKIDGYGINSDDSYEEKFLKILKEENIFVSFGMINFIPMLYECDIFSVEDETIKITEKEFDDNAQEKEGFFGILIDKNSDNYTIGFIERCNCRVGSSFRPIKKTEKGFYKRIEEIIDERIIS